ncbi:MAG TPA: type III polyketide synthase [Drouetiella sp.]
MPTRILGLGTALPDNIFNQSDSLAIAKALSRATTRQERLLEELYSKSGVSSRATVLHGSVDVKQDFYYTPDTTFDTGPSTGDRMRTYEEMAAPLATSACQAAFHQANVRASEITHLVTVSCTGFAAPGFDLALLDKLELNPATNRTHIGFMGCHGALNALRVANAYCAENPQATVLVCATELCSIHLQYGWARETIVSNALFADGAAAVILKRPEHMRDGTTYSAAASYVVPHSQSSMSWRIGDAGFVMTLASDVPELIEQNLPKFITSWLSSQGLKLAEIGSWAVHPGGPKILDAVENSLKLHPDSLSASREILSECGNMSSPTVLFILQRLLATEAKLPCVMLGFGPGLTIEAALIR